MQREQVHVLVDTLWDLGQSVLQRHNMPTAAKGHLRAARRELLLGVRALVDEAIARTEGKRQEPPAPRKIALEE